MEVQGTLAVFAEIAIAIAGFSGVVAALGSRAQSEWTVADKLRLASLLQVSLAVAFFCLLPLVLLSTDLNTGEIWRVSSVSWLVWLAVTLVISSRLYANLGAVPEDASRALLVFVLCGSAASVALQIANATILLVPWPYLASLLWGIVAAALFFVRLVRGLWRTDEPAA